jgi:hypothetical protein
MPRYETDDVPQPLQGDSSQAADSHIFEDHTDAPPADTMLPTVSFGSQPTPAFFDEDDTWGMSVDLQAFLFDLIDEDDIEGTPPDSDDDNIFLEHHLPAW